MDRAEEIRSAIAQAIDKFGLFRAYGDDHHHANIGRARQVAASIFEVLNTDGYLEPRLTTETEKIVASITQALGNYDSSAGAYPPGQWGEIGVRGAPPESDTIADAVYSNLVHLRYIAAPTA
jgi:hypothetical protein